MIARSQPLSIAKINGCFRSPFRIGTPKDDYIVCTPFVLFFMTYIMRCQTVGVHLKLDLPPKAILRETSKYVRKYFRSRKRYVPEARNVKVRIIRGGIYCIDRASFTEMEHLQRLRDII